MSAGPLPKRPGNRPATTSSGPHAQAEQNPSRELYDRLAVWIFALPDVVEVPSRVSVAGSRALWLREAVTAGPPEAFMAEREFAHLHPPSDGSLHACLPPERAREMVRAGWGEPHAHADQETEVMLYAPRDEREAEIVYRLVLESYRFAGGR